MNLQKIFIIIVICFVVVSIFFVIAQPRSETLLTVKDFISCESAGYPVMESFPRQCRTPEGTIYVEEVEIPTSKPIEVPDVSHATKTATATPALKPCVKTGCSGHVCSDVSTVTTCEFREEYACYATAICARQEDGQCGWTQSEELAQCVKEKGDEDKEL